MREKMEATPRPKKALVSKDRETAPLLPVDVGLPVGEPPPPPVAPAVGVKTAPGFAIHELTALAAPEAEEGALGLTVALPPKLHDVAALFVAW